MSDESGPRNGARERETFKKFFECWLGEQNRYLDQLISASKDYPNGAANGDSGEQAIRPLVRRVVEHYEQYYRSKSRCAKRDVLKMLTPPWRSSLESAFLWIGGWRPSMAFHLLYSKSGIQLEDHLEEVIHGLTTGDLGDLSQGQLGRVDQFQREIMRREKDVTEKMAKLQETVADATMVEISHLVSESMRGHDDEDHQPEEDGDERVEAELASKEEKMEQVLHEADDLRLETLKGVIDMLTPIQAVHFLIAAAELHLRLHEWGLRKDASENRSGSP